MGVEAHQSTLDAKARTALMKTVPAKELSADIVVTAATANRPATGADSTRPYSCESFRNRFPQFLILYPIRRPRRLR